MEVIIMFKLMLKLVLIFLISSFSFQLYSENCDSLVDLDGITSASEKFKIINGITCDTNVEITWYDNYNNGDIQVLRWGTSTNYTEEINLQPFQRRTNTTTKIPNLEPNTKYYAQFNRKYRSNIKNVEFTFTTLAVVFINNIYAQSKGTVNAPYEKNGKLHINWNVGVNDKILLTNFQGKGIASFYGSNNNNLYELSTISNGIYLILHLRAGKIVNSNKLFINF